MRFMRSGFSAVVFFVFLLICPELSAQQLFDSWVTYSVSKRPACVFSVDIDLDGDLDLIVSHTQVDLTQRNPVIILKNNGAGIFVRDTTLHTRGNPVQVMARDLDADGDIDIVTVNNSTHKVSIFKNRGGNLGFELPLDCPVGTSPLGVAVDLIDGDGIPDILAGNNASGTVSMLINHGAAAFPAETTKFLGVNPRSITVFDYDLDGDLDIAAGMRVHPQDRKIGINGVVVMENKGGGRFDDSARVFYKIPLVGDTARVDTLFNPTQVIAADFNGDGYPDLALADSATGVLVSKATVAIFINVPSRGGVYRSTDNGTNWAEANPGMTNREIRVFAFNDGGEIFAGTRGGGVFRSTDAGANWGEANNGLTNTSVTALAVNDTNHLFAGTIGGGGVFRSTNDGITWTAASSGLTNPITNRSPDVRALVVNGGGLLYAATPNGVFRSTNNAITWNKIVFGMTIIDTNILSLAVNSSGHIFAGAADSGVFRSTNLGSNWERPGSGITPGADVFALAIDSSGNLLAGTSSGVFRSTDNGTSWTAVNNGLTNTNVRALAVHSNGEIFAGTFSGGIFRSTDGGASWSAANTGLANSRVMSLAAHPGGTLFAGTNGALSTTNFLPPVHYRVGLGCRSIFAADLDGEGDVDLAAVNSIDGSVSILKNNGNGTFANRVDYLTAAQPYWVTGGDYDREGDVDLAVAGFAGAAVAVMRNTGNGVFEVGNEFSTGSASLSQGIACADFDADGDNDLIVGNFNRDQVSLHRNNGSPNIPGKFPSPPLSSDFLFAGNPRSVAFADLDGDGDLDIAAANQAFAVPPSVNGSVAVLRSNGNGTFAAAVFYNLAPGSFPHAILARDLDADGDSDLVTADFGLAKITVLKNNASANFSDTTSYHSGDLAHALAAGDFNRDGFWDLAVINQGLDGRIDSIAVLTNGGGANFAARATYVVGSRPTGVAAADFNGDGWADLAVSNAGDAENEDNSVRVMLNNRAGSFSPPATLIPAAGPVAIIAVDMNRDGYLDIVTADSSANAVSFFANNGDGTFVSALNFGAGLNPRGLAACDLNGDGDLELAVTNEKMVNDPPNAAVDHGGFTVLTNLSEGLCFARGDLNGDLAINVSDVVLLSNCVFLPSGTCPLCTADVNCDGSLSPLDVVLLLRKVFNGIALPC